MIAVLRLWHMGLEVPLYYARGGDELIMLTWTKALLDDGWYITVSHLGAPFAMSFGDFPVPNLLHLIVLKIFVTITRSASVAVNLYFLVGFPLIAVFATYVLRRLHVNSYISVCLSVVYAFLPMRFLRNEAHLFYAQYFLTPLLVLAVVWVMGRNELVNVPARRLTRDGWIYLIALLMISWDNQYDAVFGAILLAFAAFVALVRYKSYLGFATALSGIVVLFLGLEFALLPNTIYNLRNGINPAAILRPTESSEIYALTFAQLVLPIEGHRIPSFAQTRAFYDAALPVLVNENSFVTLGFLGSLGFVGGIAALLAVLKRTATSTWADLATVNVVAFFLTTVGGFGAILSYYYLPDLRAYNRISPLIAFASLAIIGIGLSRIELSWLSRRYSRGWQILVALICLLAVTDQTSPDYVPAYAADRAAFAADAAFATTVERQLSPGASIYQLPHVVFPESPTVVRLGSWDQTALYLHSTNLHYSFGTTRGRPQEAWQLRTEALPTRDFVSRLIVAGFEGICVYTKGYTDSGAVEIGRLATETGVPPIVGNDGLIAFFDLSKLRSAYLAVVGATRAERAREETVQGSVDFDVGSGFYGIESDNSNAQWMWSGPRAQLNVHNTSGTPQIATVSLLAANGTSKAALHITLPGDIHISKNLSPTGTEVSATFIAPAGDSSVVMQSDAPRLDAPTDPRDLRFRLLHWSIMTEDAAIATAAVDRILADRSLLPSADVSTSFGKGAYGQEYGGTGAWQWCSNECTVAVVNRFNRPLHATARFSLLTAQPAIVSVHLGKERFTLHSSRQAAETNIHLIVPVGTSTLVFRSSAKAFVAPADPRHLIFQVRDFFLGAPRSS
jgi:phosphoglycerol transferase